VDELTTRTGHRVVVEIDDDGFVTLTGWSVDGKPVSRQALRRIAGKYLNSPILMHPRQFGIADGREFVRDVYV